MTDSDSIKIIHTNVYSFDKTHAPAARALPGEMLRFQTLDCFSNRLTSEEVLPSHLNYGYDVCNPATVVTPGNATGNWLLPHSSSAAK